MEKPEFGRGRERIAQRLNKIVEAEERLDERVLSLLERLKKQGVNVPREVAQIVIVLHYSDPYPDNLGDRWTRPTSKPSTNQMSDNFSQISDNLSHDFDAPWYQGRI